VLDRSLSRGPLFPPLLPREKTTNPRIQNRFCRRIKTRNRCVGHTHGKRKTENGNPVSVSRFPFSNPGSPEPGPVGQTCTPELRHFSRHFSMRPPSLFCASSGHRQTDARAESRFPNPTVRAGSADGLKRGTVVSRTNALREFIYKI